MTTYETIFNWYAKRAGGRITVYGRTEAGNPRRIPHVDRIEPDAGLIKAIDKDNRVYVLAHEPR